MDVVADVSQPADTDVPESKAPDSVPNPFSVPNSFIERFLWSPQNEHPSAYMFPPGLIAEAHAVASYNFIYASSLAADAVQPEDKSLEILTERSITLYCPHRGGNSIIDSVVTTVAARQRADVLVLDALELAAGKCGALGEGAASTHTMPFRLMCSDVSFSDHILFRWWFH